MAAPPETETRYRETLRDQGYVAVPFAIGGADINPLFDEFREFADLVWPTREAMESTKAYAGRVAFGTELEEALHVDIPERSEDGDWYMVHRRIGEIDKHSRTPATENKDLLHTGPRTLTTVRERLGRRMPEVMTRMLERCEEIHEAAKASARPVFQELGIADIMLARDPWNDIHMIRILHYFGTNDPQQADMHFDRSVATIAAWESSPGLMGVPGNNNFRYQTTREEVDDMLARAAASPIDHVSGEAKFFLGAGYNRLGYKVLDANGDIPLLAHGVGNPYPDQDRFAAVVFMNPHLGVTDYVVPSKAETSMTHLRDLLTIVE
jgi:hypothetical protein